MYLRRRQEMHTNKDYLDAMNRMNKDLAPDNRDYFKKLREYMGMASLIKDEISINQQLYQMHLDFMNAQEDGMSAEEFFGNDPKTMADQLLEEIQRTSFKTLLQYVGIVAVIMWGSRYLSDFNKATPVVVNPALYLFDLILVFSLVMLLFKVIQISVYRKNNSKKLEWMETVIAALVFIVFIIIYLRADQFIPMVLPFTISPPWNIILFLIVLLSAVFLFWKGSKILKQAE